jgi:hypothetical protein
MEPSLAAFARIGKALFLPMQQRSEFLNRRFRDRNTKPIHYGRVVRISIPYSGAMAIMCAISAGPNGNGWSVRLWSGAPEASKKRSIPEGVAVSMTKASFSPVFLK